MKIEFLDKVIWRQILHNMGHMILSNALTCSLPCDLSFSPKFRTTLFCQVSLSTGLTQYTSSVASIIYLSFFGQAYRLAHRSTQANWFKKSATLAWDQLVENDVLLLDLAKSKVWLILWQHFVFHKVKPKQSCQAVMWEGLFRSLIQLLTFIWAGWRRDFKPVGTSFFSTEGFCPEAH